MSWRVARSLDVLLDEINDAAPSRSKISDGSIGDAAHASRSSDHNPWVTLGGWGIVRARDFTHDPAGGLDCQKLADHLAGMLRAGGHPALGSGAYVIWRRRILSRDRLGEGWRAYSGSNPHDHHLHLSVATSAAGFDSTRPWGWDAPMEDPMTQYADLLNDLKTTAERTERKVDRLTKRGQKQTDRLAALAKRLNEYDRNRDGDAEGLLKAVAADLKVIANQLREDEPR